MYRLLLLVFLFSLFSCDCLQRAGGVVYDRSTRLPLDSVEVHLADKTYNSCFTDTGNQYQISNITGGLKADCKHLNLIFKRRGYKTFRIQACSECSDTIWMEKLN